MQITFDEQADALYIQFQPSKGKVKETLKLRDGILVDIGRNNKIFGLEILDASQRIPLEQISHVGIDLPIHV